jgi:hypothetical protein
VEEGLQLPDAIDVHDRSAVDANEAVGVEPALDLRHRLAQEVSLRARVYTHVVAC